MEHKGNIKTRRRVLEELVLAKRHLLQSPNPHQLLAHLMEELFWEFIEKRLEGHLLQTFINKTYIYARDDCTATKEKERELRDYHNYFIESADPLAGCVEALDPKKIDLKDLNSLLQAFRNGTYAEATIMGYTKWLIHVAFRHPFLSKKRKEIHTAFRVFSVYLRWFLTPRIPKKKETTLIEKVKNIVRYPLRIGDAFTGGKVTKLSAAVLDRKEDSLRAYLEGKDKKEHLIYLPLGSQINEIIRSINDIIEEYLKVLQPSSYFLTRLQALEKTKD